MTINLNLTRIIKSDSELLAISCLFPTKKSDECKILRRSRTFESSNMMKLRLLITYDTVEWNVH